MAAPDELASFVRDALTSGRSRTEVEEILLQAGWTRDQARSALSTYADVAFPIPVPRPKVALSARETFLYLLLFATLYITAYNFGALIFEFINRAFPDVATSGRFNRGRSTIRFSVASLVVAFPVFIVMARITAKEVATAARKHASIARRWLTYLTLFIAAGVLIGDFISLVYNFLGGELTTRFVLKVLTVGGIAGGVLGYYLADLRAEERETAP